MDQHPLISIIVPCYNQSAYLDECIASVLAQSFTDWECIIVNDGSLDDSEQIALKWTERDARIKYHKKENGGIATARNEGINLAKGTWILPLDGDDRIGPDYLKLAAAKFDEGYTVIYCNAEKFGLKQGFWPIPEYSYKALLIDNLIFCTAFYKREDFFKAGGYDTAMTHGLEDWEFLIRLLDFEAKVYKIPEVCFYYRIKADSRTISLSKEDFHTQMLSYMEQKHLALYQKTFGNYRDIMIQNNTMRAFLRSKRYMMVGRLLKLIGLQPKMDF